MMKKLTRAALLEAGWYQEREFDITSYSSANAKEGHSPLGCAAKQFLESYGGLDLRGRTGRFHFNVKKACKVPVEWVEEYEQQLGVPLSVIGKCEDGHLTLMMDASGVAYGVSGELLVLVAKSGEAAIESLLQGEEQRVLYSGHKVNDRNPHAKRAHLGG